MRRGWLGCNFVVEFEPEKCKLLVCRWCSNATSTVMHQVNDVRLNGRGIPGQTQ